MALYKCCIIIIIILLRHRQGYEVLAISLSVCLSICPLAYLKTYLRLYMMLTVAMARSFSNDSACVLKFFVMVSKLSICIGPTKLYNVLKAINK